MPCKCVECGGKVDCDSIICADCLAEIIDRVNLKNSDQAPTLTGGDKVKIKNG